jgi:uncharacterized protein
VGTDFRKRSCSTKSLERDSDSKKSCPAPGDRGCGRGKMGQFLVALGLVLVIEGLLFAAFPAAAKRLAATALETPENSLRIAGIVSAVLGLILIWLVRG